MIFRHGMQFSLYQNKQKSNLEEIVGLRVLGKIKKSPMGEKEKALARQEEKFQDDTQGPLNTDPMKCITGT
jgi:hypothetical protein